VAECVNDHTNALKDKQKTLRPNKEFQVYSITVPAYDITICEDIHCELEKIF
jgi:hypothetical protein